MKILKEVPNQIFLDGRIFDFSNPDYYLRVTLEKQLSSRDFSFLISQGDFEREFLSKI